MHMDYLIILDWFALRCFARHNAETPFYPRITLNSNLRNRRHYRL